MYPINKTMRTKLFLSVIQCVVAFVGIVTEAIILSSNDGKQSYGLDDLGTGIWCGILFGLSGSLGIVASLKQNEAWITASMISSIIAAVFGIPFFINSYGQAYRWDIPNREPTNHMYPGYVAQNTAGTKHAMFAIQMAISITQIFASASSSALSCQAVCNCCKNSNGYENQKQSLNFPKLSMKHLSLVQLLVAILIVIMETAMEALNSSKLPFGGEIWIGIIIGISGIMGLITSSNAFSLQMALLVVFDIIGVTFCFPLIVTSSLGVSELTVPFGSRRVGWDKSKPQFALSATILALSIFEVVITICSLVLACRSICNCCRPNEESGTIHYSHAYRDNDGSVRLNTVNTQSAIFKPTQRYNNVPMREMECESVAMAKALPESLSMNGVPTGSLVSFDSLSKENNGSFTQDPFLESNSNSFENNCSKWQRFE